MSVYVLGAIALTQDPEGEVVNWSPSPNLYNSTSANAYIHDCTVCCSCTPDSRVCFVVCSVKNMTIPRLNQPQAHTQHVTVGKLPGDGRNIQSLRYKTPAARLNSDVPRTHVQRRRCDVADFSKAARTGGHTQPLDNYRLAIHRSAITDTLLRAALAEQPFLELARKGADKFIHDVLHHTYLPPQRPSIKK